MALANSSRETFEKDLKYTKEILERDLNFLKNQGQNKVVFDHFLFPLERSLSADKSFYEKTDKIKVAYSTALEKCLGKTTNDDIAKDIMQRYCNNVFGIFDNVLDLYASDIFILKDKIAMSSENSALGMDYIDIPDDLKDIYIYMVKRFIQVTIYSSAMDKTKFDRVNAILDYTVRGIRFNVVHSSLNADGGKEEAPIISLRKQIIAPKKDNAIANNSKYLDSVCSSAKQKEFLNKIAFNGSYIIYGETGSGKTTLMKYMGGYRLDEKRNLITIEDTPELYLPNNIAYLTNNVFTISDLFKVTLRENPSHLLIGETRSEEIVDILESSLVFKVGTTLHADSFEKVIMRINFLIKGAKNDYSTNDINSLITAGVDGFIHMRDRHIVEVRKRKDNVESMEDVLMNYEKVL